MPVVIHKYDYARWLNPDTPFDELRQMMQPLPNEETHTTKFEAEAEAQNENVTLPSNERNEPPKDQASLFDI
jgi:putative SOS response-associated peptidase YedK